MSYLPMEEKVHAPELSPAPSDEQIEKEPVVSSPSNGEPKEQYESPRPSWELRETASGRPIRATLSRRESALSVIRSRGPNSNVHRKFSHKLEHIPTDKDVLVDFDGPDDPYRPLNWPFKKKIITTALYGFTTMGITFASSVYSAGVQQVEQEFHIGNEVSSLGISLLLLGFGFGPLLWAPLSELYGRKSAVLIPYFIAAVFSFASGAAKDIQTLMITRFFAGFFGSAPITNTGGVLGDIYTPQQRGVAIVGYAIAVVGGPTLGPVIGGAITQSYLGWRWTEYITGILMMFILVLDVLIIDESYPPRLLVYKARRLRIESGNWALHAKFEEWDVSLKEMARKYLVRPFQLLATPICLLVAIYASFCYGILYANLSAFPIVFQELRGWNQVVGGLPFLSILVGIFIASAINISNQKYYFKKFAQNNNRPVPEARLPPMMIGSVFFSAGLFIFAWTADPSIHWIAPVIGAALIGIGFFTIFQGALNYLIDTFQRYSASAIAANTFLRSVFAAAFPLFITPELKNLGVGWGVSLFAFISVALIPIPYLFFVFGKRIRAKGFWSRESV